jgi:hypothetical protein
MSVSKYLTETIYEEKGLLAHSSGSSQIIGHGAGCKPGAFPGCITSWWMVMAGAYAALRLHLHPLPGREHWLGPGLFSSHSPLMRTPPK